MLRMGKLTDYGIVLMSYLASKTYQKHSAHTLSDAVSMPLPTVRKVLKELKSPIITLAEEPRDKKHSFWQQLKNILR